MKIVINACFGGFNLSEAAVIRYNELLGRQVWIERYNSFVVYQLTPPPAGGKDEANDNKHAQTMSFYPRSLERNDPLLIKVIEEMGAAANGIHSSLKIVEIPDDVEWVIDDYDGDEWVAEKHRKWS